MRTAPAAIAGAIISFEAAKNDIELCTLVWILCYGAALLAMGEVAPRSLKRLGWSFIIFGTVFFLIWMKFKAALSPVLGIGYLGSASIMMIATFGILHIGHGIGVLIRKEKLIFVIFLMIDFDKIDKIIHEKGRLSIMTLLASRGSWNFQDMKDQLKMSDGNLITHLRSLQNAGYLNKKKNSRGERLQIIS